MRRPLRAAILACGLVFALLTAATTVSAQSGAASRAVPRLPGAADLAADARTSARDRIPILLFFSREDCPYCRRALAEYLVPMSGEPQWRGRAAFRQVEIDQALPLIDFDGATTTHAELARRFAVRFTPTVLVVGPDGKPLARPIIGLPADFYLGYLEQAIEAGTQALRRPTGAVPASHNASSGAPERAALRLAVISPRAEEQTQGGTTR